MPCWSWTKPAGTARRRSKCPTQSRWFRCRPTVPNSTPSSGSGCTCGSTFSPTACWRATTRLSLPAAKPSTPSRPSACARSPTSPGSRKSLHKLNGISRHKLGASCWRGSSDGIGRTGWNIVSTDAFAQEHVVPLAQLRWRIVVEERQEGVASSACHFRNSVQERAREHHRAARRRLERARAIFRKAHFPAFELAVEVDGDGEAAVRCTLCGVVAVRPKMRAILSRVARDDVALHAGHPELMDLEDLGHDAALDTGLGLLDQVPILDVVV